MKRSVLNKLLLGSLVLNLSISPIVSGCGGKNVASPSENREVVSSLESQNETDNEEAQKNSYYMMCYLALVSENIRTSKDNRLALYDIHDELLELNPDVIDKRTKKHWNELCDTIETFCNISVKRDRAKYIYEQDKAQAMKNSVADTLKESLKESQMDLRELAINVLSDIVDSCLNQNENMNEIDREYLMTGWDLDDAELAAIQNSRDESFNYMVDMVHRYKLDGLKTLSDEDIKRFVEISKIESPKEKIIRLKAEEDRYENLGNYWCELADCYFKIEEYDKVLDCLKTYEDLSIGIYRQDRNAVELYMEAIVAVQKIHAADKNKYVSSLDEYAVKIKENTTSDDWETRYFLAQVYIDLYAKTGEKDYLQNAYDRIRENVTVLLDGQRDINTRYLKDVELIAVDSALTKAEKKQIKEYNKKMEKDRKNECVALYEPLILNCELLFELAEELDISQAEKNDIDEILKKRDIFLVDPIKNLYAFNKTSQDYDIEVKKDEIIIPASMLTDKAVIEIKINNNGEETLIENYEIEEVDRKGTDIDQFYAHIYSKTWKKYSWDEDVHITIKIIYPDAYDNEVTMKYKVGKYKDGWFGDTVEFVKE